MPRLRPTASHPLATMRQEKTPPVPKGSPGWDARLYIDSALAASRQVDAPGYLQSAGWRQQAWFRASPQRPRVPAPENGHASRCPPAPSLTTYLDVADPGRPLDLVPLEHTEHFDRAPVTARMRACAQQLLQGRWQPACVVAAQASYGPKTVRAVSLGCALDVLLLRQAYQENGEPDNFRDHFLSHLEIIVASLQPLDLGGWVSAEPAGFVGTLAAHAARFLDSQALLALFRRMPQQALDAPVVEPGHLSVASIYSYASVALESPLWPHTPQRGQETLSSLLLCIDTLYATSGHQSPPLRRVHRDGLIRVVVGAKKLDTLSLVAREARTHRATGGPAVCHYLFWVIEDRWPEGLAELLRLGVSPNDRMPGTYGPHPSFAVGITPLMAALTNTCMTDAMSLRMAQLLRQYGAYWGALSYAMLPGTASVEISTASDQAIAAGLKHRWQPLEDEIAIETSSDAAAWREKLESLIRPLHLLREQIENNPEPHLADSVICAVGALFTHLHTDKLGLASCYHPLNEFNVQTARLFFCEGPQQMPYTVGRISGSADKVAPVFYDKPFERNSLNQLDRLKLWAERITSGLNPLELRADSISYSGTSDRPVDWIDDLAKASRKKYAAADNFSALYDVTLATWVDQNRLAEVEAVLDSTTSPRPKAHALAFLMLLIEVGRKPQTAQHSHMQRLAQKIVDACEDVVTAAALIEMALRQGDAVWLKHVLDHCTARAMSLRSDTSKAEETLLHLGADAPVQLLKVLVAGMPKSWRASCLQACDEAGDTPLHRAARRGQGQCRALVSGLDAAFGQALQHASRHENASGQTPALEALMANQPAAFVFLSRYGDTAGRGSLARALGARRGMLTPTLWHQISQLPQSIGRVREEAAELGRHLAYMGDCEGLETLLRHVASEVLHAPRGRTTLLHALAKADREDVLALICRVAPALQVRELARHRDRHHQLPEDYATEPALQAALTALRDVPQTVTKARPNRRTSLPKLVRDVAAQDRSEGLERAVTLFCHTAWEHLQKPGATAEDAADTERLAWQVVDHIDRAPVAIGVRMGLHLAMHRPQVSDAALRRRVEATRHGATRFGLTGGLALLRGRLLALDRARRMALDPGMRTVLDVACPGLGGAGYMHAAGAVVRLGKADTLRTVFAQTPQGLVLITAYAIASQLISEGA